MIISRPGPTFYGNIDKICRILPYASHELNLETYHFQNQGGAEQ